MILNFNLSLLFLILNKKTKKKFINQFNYTFIFINKI